MPLNFIKPIDEEKYYYVYSRDEELMVYYESLLKSVHLKLSLQTKLDELAKLLSVTKEWDRVLAHRLNNAPSMQIAMDIFKAELLTLVDCSDVEGEENDNYLAKLRYVGYNRSLSGENPPLIALGHLVLKEVYQHVDGEDNLIKVSAPFDVEVIVRTVAQGAALAYYLNDPQRFIASVSNEVESTNTSTIRERLRRYNFFELEKVAKLKNSDGLINLLVNSKTPYQVAMLEYLGFNDYLRKNHSNNSNTKRNEILAKILGVSFDTAKNLVNTLTPNAGTSEDRKARYTSWMHVKTVINDYNKLH